MANSWFRFQQFMIHQDRCAMKVGTDGVLLGALADVPAAGEILDIGTGTGLVALMIAQRSNAHIDAVEVDAGAAEQAAENAGNSPWQGQIRVIHRDFMEFYPSCGKKYDLVVSNPPYFRNSLESKTREKALARHGSEEFYRELLKGCAGLLQPWGECFLILPAGFAAELEDQAAEVQLYVQGRTAIRSNREGKVIRKLISLGRKATSHITENELVIYEKAGEYTAEFGKLVKPYYLNSGL